MRSMNDKNEELYRRCRSRRAALVRALVATLPYIDTSPSLVVQNATVSYPFVMQTDKINSYQSFGILGAW